MGERLLIFGAGGHGRAVAEAALLAGFYDVAGFADDAAPGIESVWDLPVVGRIVALRDYRSVARCAIVAIGNNQLRSELNDQLRAAGFELATIVHPGAQVSPRARVGIGSTLMAGAVIGTEASLGEGVIINCGAVVDHHCRVEDYGHVGTNATMAGGSVLGRAAWMQAGSSLGYRVRVAPGEVLKPGESRSSE